MHLDATHTHAILLSIPRDTIVYEPGCQARPGIEVGVWGPYQSAIIDGAMNIGGPSCAVKTVEDLTGGKLDHFVMFDFNSFRKMVDVLGGQTARAGRDPGPPAGHVTLITMPTVLDTSPAESGRLLPEEPQDDVIFQMLSDGQRWHGQLPTQPLRKVKVRVVNGTGTAGLAGQTARKLRKLGFDVVVTGNTAPTATTTVTYAGTAQADSAYTLMTALTAAPAAQDLLAEPAPQRGRAGPVTLILGTDFAGVSPAAGAQPSARAGHHRHRRHQASTAGPGSVQSRNAGASICSGLPTANPHPGAP